MAWCYRIFWYNDIRTSIYHAFAKMVIKNKWAQFLVAYVMRLRGSAARDNVIFSSY